MSKVKRRTRRAPRKGKQKSKADQALSLAKSNKRNILEDRGINLDNYVLAHGTALNATPVVRYIGPSQMKDYKIRMYNIYLDMIIRYNVTATSIDDYRFDIVLDRAPNGVTLTPLLYLASATPTVTALKIVGGQGRYEILRSYSGCVFEETDSFVHVKDKIPINKMFVSKVTGSTTNVNCIKNAIFVVMWTTSGANQPTIGYNLRLTTPDET